MTVKRYQVRDTIGAPWVVAPGDPAHPALDRLRGLGWAEDELRLPARVIATGAVSVFAIEQAKDTVFSMSDDADPEMDGPLTAAHNTLKQLEYLAKE